MNTNLLLHEALLAAKAKSDGRTFDGLEAVTHAFYTTEVPRLRRLAAHICKDYDDAEDAVGAVIFSLPRLIQSYNGNNPSAYFSRCVSNESIDIMRRQRRQDRYETPEWNTGSISEVQQDAVQDLVGEIVRTMPPTYRAAYVSFNLEGKTLNEIAETRAMPVNSVKTGIYRGKAHARKYRSQFEDIFS